MFELVTLALQPELAERIPRTRNTQSVQVRFNVVMRHRRRKVPDEVLGDAELIVVRDAVRR